MRGPLDADESEAMEAFDRPDSTNDPGHLALLTEFHQQIEALPEEQRRIFEMHYYGGFSQVEIARMLGCRRSRSAGSGWPRRDVWPDGSTGWKHRCDEPG
jgi:RNA polymerase sigma factor (sigma-70 family)